MEAISSTLFSVERATASSVSCHLAEDIDGKMLKAHLHRSYSWSTFANAPRIDQRPERPNRPSRIF
jgi:hypothetical protein